MRDDSWLGRVMDPDVILFGVASAFAIGVWILAWPQPSDPRAGWRTYMKRWAMRILALAAPVAVGLMWFDWRYVPWWDFGRYQAAASRIVLLVGPCQWLVFDHLSHLAARTRAGPPPDYFRAGRYASAFAWLMVWLFWPPGYAGSGGNSLSSVTCCCPPGALIVFVFPPALLVAAAGMFFAEWRTGARPRPTIEAGQC
jgi:hypothetical protein